jgi:predicted dehydrogenase
MMGDVESVYALGATRLARIEAEDTAVVALRFVNGALGVIEATTATRPIDLEGSITILGEGGTVEISGFAVNKMCTWRFVDVRPEDEFVLEKFSVNPPNVYGYGHQAYYEHVVAAIRGKVPQLVAGKEGRRSLEVIIAIYESIETGLPVHLGVGNRRSRLGCRHG